MKTAVIVFPGSNCDRDVQVALRDSSGSEPTMVWHGDATLPDVDLIVVPGGFSYGDYLRSGAMAAQSPVMRDVVAKAQKGVPVLGICNGFQVLTECGLLPGVLMRNANLKFVCKDIYLRTDAADTMFTGGYEEGQVIRIPVAHHDGNYFADDETLARLQDENRIAFRYVDADEPERLARRHRRDSGRDPHRPGADAAPGTFVRPGVGRRRRTTHVRSPGSCTGLAGGSGCLSPCTTTTR